MKLYCSDMLLSLSNCSWSTFQKVSWWYDLFSPWNMIQRTQLGRPSCVVSVQNTSRPIPNGAARQIIFFPASGTHVVQNIYSLTVMICNHAPDVTAIGATLQSLCMAVHCSEYQRQQTARLACLTGVYPHLAESSNNVFILPFSVQKCASNVIFVWGRNVHLDLVQGGQQL